MQLTLSSSSALFSSEFDKDRLPDCILPKVEPLEQEHSPFLCCTDDDFEFLVEEKNFFSNLYFPFSFALDSALVDFSFRLFLAMSRVSALILSARAGGVAGIADVGKGGGGGGKWDGSPGHPFNSNSVHSSSIWNDLCQRHCRFSLFSLLNFNVGSANVVYVVTVRDVPVVRLRFINLSDSIGMAEIGAGYFGIIVQRLSAEYLLAVEALRRLTKFELSELDFTNGCLFTSGLGDLLFSLLDTRL
ncbi:hypothetical protein BpHYR1_004890 [Brachionus plicatilis]|uniref:Uncharacterized protein n=1 Tax=Brachionus plicatilis TaxID=10195 RepID=A0A3M7RQY1_BRAPC|nr:hypothetical protein BpHYR1_004890 [Brachionus plicatilis]